MRFPIRWTPSAVDHIARHGVRQRHVVLALSQPVFWRASGARLVVLGDSGEAILFIVIERSKFHPHLYEVVTARRATRSEKRLFRRRVKVRL